VSYQMTGCGRYGCFGQLPKEPPRWVGGLQLELPPPCDDEANLREMLIAVGLSPPAPDASGDERMKFYADLNTWALKQGIINPSAQEAANKKALCDALVKASAGNGKPVPNGNGQEPGWWDERSTGEKVAIVGGGVATAGVVAYFVLR